MYDSGLGYTLSESSYHRADRMILTPNKPMRRPNGEVVRAVDRGSTSFDLTLNFVLFQPVETTAFLINAKSTGVSVEDVPPVLYHCAPGTMHFAFAQAASTSVVEGIAYVASFCRELTYWSDI